MPSLDIVKKISNTHLVYYPNYVEEANIAQTLTERPKDRLNLIYFGRITPDKNVKETVKAFELLCEKYDDVYLTVVGGSGYSKAYVSEVDEMIAKSPYSSHITRKGLTPFAEIKDIMQTQHIFLFPSHERAEGHSNSLSEAMAQGLVPVVSDWHFNRDIVGDERLVVSGYEAQAYADKIAQLRESCNLEELAVKMRDRVRDHFSRKTVNDRICEELKKI